MTRRRFRDPDTWLQALAAGDIEVVCPRCAARAAVTTRDIGGGPALERPRRLACPACAYSAAWPAGSRNTVWGAPVDPFFRRPLWLRTRVRGRMLWAFHRGHLDLLAHFIDAGLRERGAVGGNATLVSRLPKWIKSAKNRNDLRAALDRLREK